MLEVPAVPEVTSRGSGRSATEPVLPQKQRGGEGKRGPEGPRWVARLEGVSWAGPDSPFSLLPEPSAATAPIQSYAQRPQGDIKATQWGLLGQGPS